MADALKMMTAFLEKQDGGSRTGGGGGGEKQKRDILFGKGFDMMDKFGCGEAEWNEWSGDFRTMYRRKARWQARR